MGNNEKTSPRAATLVSKLLKIQKHLKKSSLLLHLL